MLAAASSGHQTGDGRFNRDERPLEAALALTMSGFIINHLGYHTDYEPIFQSTVVILVFFWLKVIETQLD